MRILPQLPIRTCGWDRRELVCVLRMCCAYYVPGAIGALPYCFYILLFYILFLSLPLLFPLWTCPVSLRVFVTLAVPDDPCHFQPRKPCGPLISFRNQPFST